MVDHQLGGGHVVHAEGYVPIEVDEAQLENLNELLALLAADVQVLRTLEKQHKVARVVTGFEDGGYILYFVRAALFAPFKGVDVVSSHNVQALFSGPG